MKIKKMVVGLASALLVAAALPVTVQASQHSSSHYMMHGGNGPQGHVMEGAKHDSQMSQQHKPDYESQHKAHASNKTHYMMLAGDGPQGYMMEGEKHGSVQSNHHGATDDSGADVQVKSNVHYMMNSGDGPQGGNMDGQKHPQS